MLYVDQTEYNDLIQDIELFSASYIAVDACRSGQMADTEAVVLGECWQALRDYYALTTKEAFFVAATNLGAIWKNLFNDEHEMPVIETVVDGSFEIDDEAIDFVLNRMQKEIVDRIYEVEPEHD